MDASQASVLPGISSATRTGILVLGMHRSGTSAVTGALTLAGATTPRDPMPATADNPRGYWESPRIARFNNRLLESAGTRWNDPAAIPDGWFREPAREADTAEAAALLAEEFPGPEPAALKDPRICRLLPVWLRGLGLANCDPVALFVVRRPLEVAASLAARSACEQFRPAAVPELSGGILLWLRYVLDAERHSRPLPRHLVSYEAFLADWRTTLDPFLAAARLPSLTAEAADRIGAFVDPGLRRQRAAGGSRPVPGLAVAERVREAVLESGRETLLDAIRADLERLQADQPAVFRSVGPPAGPGPEALLEELDRLWRSAGRGPRPDRSALFLSGEPRSVGHVYRVEHTVAALRAHGWQADWAPLDGLLDPDRVARADVVTVFRAVWNPALAAVRDRCRRIGVPLVYDIDDLIFDSEVAAAGRIALLDGASEADLIFWKTRIEGYRAALAAADAAVLTTQPLAAAAAHVCPRTFVLPNALGPAMAEAAATAREAAKPSEADGRPRLLFASGTPTHHRDFAVAAEAVARLFRRRPDPMLIVLGPLDLGCHPVLAPFRDRVDCRPRVPFEGLFAEVARADINLCPLELGNPFCESKSNVRWLTAAAVGVPSVVSPTGPLHDAVCDGQTGLVAADVEDWERGLDSLASDPGLRQRLGEAARSAALERFGFETWSRTADNLYAGIAAGHGRPRQR
jgi:glycosyltransferase involved in cell wall biosynthesis